MSEPLCWKMPAASIEAARAALEIGIENTQELLIVHDENLGRTTRSNQWNAERLEDEIAEMKAAVNLLQAP